MGYSPQKKILCSLVTQAFCGPSHLWKPSNPSDEQQVFQNDFPGDLTLYKATGKLT